MPVQRLSSLDQSVEVGGEPLVMVTAPGVGFSVRVDAGGATAGVTISDLPAPGERPVAAPVARDDDMDEDESYFLEEDDDDDEDDAGYDDDDLDDDYDDDEDDDGQSGGNTDDDDDDL